ncbi:MAG: ABC transporter ATP-binding protein [Phycisphaerae bacterium]|nr:MAG: ABC transporter ATP-binding protein [Phycisphaerae bacterium]
MTPPVLSLEGLTITFRGAPHPAVADVSMSLNTGRTLAVVGESGSGKTLTALAAIGLLPADATIDRGDIMLRAASDAPINLRTATAKVWRQVRGSKVAMIFQEPMTALNPVFTIGEQLTDVFSCHRGLGGRDARRAAAEALAEVGIPEPARRLDHYPHEFSGGMRQRVMIALALAGNPRVLLADEPTTALDVSLRAQVLDLIDALRRERDLAVMLITHDLALAARRADDVCVMYAGRVVERGPARRVLDHPRHPYTRCLLRCVPSERSRGQRLATVAELLADAAEFAPVDGRTPWWPGRSAAPGALAEIEPGHAVLVEG